MPPPRRHHSTFDKRAKERRKRALQRYVKNVARSLRAACRQQRRAMDFQYEKYTRKLQTQLKELEEYNAEWQRRIDAVVAEDTSLQYLVAKDPVEHLVLSQRRYELAVRAADISSKAHQAFKERRREGDEQQQIWAQELSENLDHIMGPKLSSRRSASQHSAIDNDAL